MLADAVMEARQTYNRLAASSSLSSWSRHSSISILMVSGSAKRPKMCRESELADESKLFCGEADRHTKHVQPQD